MFERWSKFLKKDKKYFPFVQGLSFIIKLLFGIYWQVFSSCFKELIRSSPRNRQFTTFNRYPSVSLLQKYSSLSTTNLHITKGGKSYKIIANPFLGRLLIECEETFNDSLQLKCIFVIRIEDFKKYKIFLSNQITIWIWAVHIILIDNVKQFKMENLSTGNTPSNYQSCGGKNFDIFQGFLI